MRKHISDGTIANVLIKSRRRCCLCFGLEKDHKIKLQGQIAHLDHHSENNDENNLAYLCLVHHSIYDSKNEQIKTLTLAEAMKYRDDLYEFNRSYFDTSEEMEILLCVKSEKRVSFRAIRRYVYIINCSDTRAAETQRQIEDLVNMRVLIDLGSGEYMVNNDLINGFKKQQ